MTPLAILHDIIQIARLIRNQVHLMQNNKLKFSSLIDTIDCLVESLNKVGELPDTEQFKKSLFDLKNLCQATVTFINDISQKGRMERFINANTYSQQIDAFKMQILELVPILNVGLTAQMLMNRERDRFEEAADHQELLAQQERHFRELQAAHFNAGELEKIIRQQMASLEERVLQQMHKSPIEKLSEKSTLPQEYRVSLADIVFQNKMSDSDLGAMYHGLWKHQAVTIKWLEGIDVEEDRHHFMREAKVMSRLRNEYIAQFYGACFEETRLCLLMSVMEKGNLGQILSTLSLQERFSIAQDLSQGLAYLHSEEIIHGDINPEHVGVNRYNQAKWTDFGLAKTRTISLASVKRTSRNVLWQAPESWQRRSILTSSSDIYSFGLLLWTLMTGNLPYASIPPHEVMTQISNGFREAIPANIPRELAGLINACWSPIPTQRPNALEVMQILKSITLEIRPASPTGEELYQQAAKVQNEGNLIEAYQLFNRACEKNYIRAFTNIGLFKLKGLGGQPANKIEAMQYLERAANGGHARAMFNLARIYEKGDTQTRQPDLTTALEWYQRALAVDPTDKQCSEKITTLTTLLQRTNSDYRFNSSGF